MTLVAEERCRLSPHTPNVCYRLRSPPNGSWNGPPAMVQSEGQPRIATAYVYGHATSATLKSQRRSRHNGLLASCPLYPRYRTFVMSVLPLKADIHQREWHVRYVPIVDMAIAEWLKRGNADDVDARSATRGRPRAGPFLRWCSADFSGRVPLAYDRPRLG